jgi:hypothetical protein
MVDSIRVDRATGPEARGSYGEHTATHFRASTECDGAPGQNGAFKNTGGPNGCRCTDSPQDVLRLGPVKQDESCARTGRQGGVTLEKKLGVLLVETVQSDGSGGGYVYGGGIVGSGRESLASDFGSNRRTLESHRHFEKITQVIDCSWSGPVVDGPVFKRINASEGANGTHVPVVDGGSRERNGSSSLDTESSTELARE